MSDLHFNLKVLLKQIQTHDLDQMKSAAPLYMNMYMPGSIILT